MSTTPLFAQGSNHDTGAQTPTSIDTQQDRSTPPSSVASSTKVAAPHETERDRYEEEALDHIGETLRHCAAAAKGRIMPPRLANLGSTHEEIENKGDAALAALSGMSRSSTSACTRPHFGLRNWAQSPYCCLHCSPAAAIKTSARRPLLLGLPELPTTMTSRCPSLWVSSKMQVKLRIKAIMREVEKSNGEPVLAADLEGDELGCKGTISLVQLYVIPLNRVFLVDMAMLGEQAFTTTTTFNDQEVSLKTIMEDANIRKLFFDCRGDAEALKSIFDVTLRGVIDVQLMDLVTKSTNSDRKSVLGLTTVVPQRLQNTNISTATLDLFGVTKYWGVLAMQHGFETAAREYEYYAGDRDAREDFLLQHVYFEHIRQRTERHRLWLADEDKKAAAKLTVAEAGDEVAMPVASDGTASPTSESIGTESSNGSDDETASESDSNASISTTASSSDSITTVGFPAASPLTFLDVSAKISPMTSNYSSSLTAKNDPFAIRPLPIWLQNYAVNDVAFLSELHDHFLEHPSMSEEGMAVLIHESEGRLRSSQMPGGWAKQPNEGTSKAPLSVQELKIVERRDKKR